MPLWCVDSQDTLPKVTMFIKTAQLDVIHPLTEFYMQSEELHNCKRQSGQSRPIFQHAMCNATPKPLMARRGRSPVSESESTDKTACQGRLFCRAILKSAAHQVERPGSPANRRCYRHWHCSLLPDTFNILSLTLLTWKLVYNLWMVTFCFVVSNSTLPPPPKIYIYIYI